jgi:hypothetical protein
MFHNCCGINKVHTTRMNLLLILILILSWRGVYFRFLSFVMQLESFANFCFVISGNINLVVKNESASDL